MTSYFTLFFLLFAAIAHSQDSVFITVHIIYGSKPEAPGQHKWFGGKLGGHMGLEIAPDRVIHFNPGGKVRVFGRKDETGNYRESAVEDFYCTFGCDTVKRLMVRIPVAAKDQARLDSITRLYLENAPYPYAFFGMRCTAATFHMLSAAEVFDKRSKARMIIRYFYPRRLRKKLIREARKQHWEVLRSGGSSKRKWGHD